MKKLEELIKKIITDEERLLTVPMNMSSNVFIRNSAAFKSLFPYESHTIGKIVKSFEMCYFIFIKLEFWFLLCLH